MHTYQIEYLLLSLGALGWGERIKCENAAAGFVVSYNREMGVKIPISHLIPLCTDMIEFFGSVFA